MTILDGGMRSQVYNAIRYVSSTNRKLGEFVASRMPTQLYKLYPYSRTQKRAMRSLSVVSAVNSQHCSLEQLAHCIQSEMASVTIFVVFR